MSKVQSPFAHFGTNKKKEDAGVWIDYGNYGFQVRRLGSSNKRFVKMMETEMRPHKTLIKRNKMDDATADAISRKVFASTVLVNWRRAEVDKDGERTGWKIGAMLTADGKDQAFTVDNAIELFEQLPDLFDELYQQATDFSTFNADEEAGTAKN